MRRNIVRKRILVVEDNDLNREILVNILSDSYDVVEASNGQEALDVLGDGNGRIDLIMLDVVMPVMDGYTFLEKLRENRMLSVIPVIIATQSDSDESEIEALKRGATDFISKPYKGQVIKHRIESILRLRDTAAIVNQLQYDNLTGIYSRNYFFHRAEEILDANPETEYNIVCTNIVNFKVYNEVFGEKKGNEFLVNMAGVLEKSLGDTGICGRFGGDRFVVLQERDCEEHARSRFDSAGVFTVEGLSVKFGVYEIYDRSVSIDSMCDRGFLAADSIKNKYNIGIAVYDDELRTRLLREKKITESMETAVDNNEFEIYYQPKYDVDSIRITGAEALLRWNHKELGYVSPGEFISIFEKNGFITKLDKYVFDSVCRQLGEWRRTGIEFPPVSVNLSRADVYCSDIVEYIMNCIEKNNLVPQDVHVEITESAYTEHPEQIIRMVERMRNSGLAIELDDFGSGYSSLNMLNEIKADYLKMDMRFIQTKNQKQTQQGILQLITNLAGWMNMKVVAEGVETEEQLMRIRAVGCDYVQGYLFSKPLPAAEFEELLRTTDLDVPQYNVKDYEPAVIIAADDEEYAEAVKQKLENEFVIYRTKTCEETCEYLDKKADAVILSSEMPGDYERLFNKLKEKRKHEKLPVISVFPPGIVTDEMMKNSPGDEIICRCHPVSDLRNKVMNLIITD